MLSRWIRLPLAGLAAIAVLSGCGTDVNPVAPSPQLDTTSPPAPENLTLSADASGHAVLVWSENAAPDVVGYQVVVLAGSDYVPASDVLSADNIFYLPTVEAPVDASYRVRAVDAAGNWSAFSAAANITIPVWGDPLEI